MNGFPIWDDSSTYPTEKAFTEAERLLEDPLYTSKSWAWQFLRRNDSYKNDYDRLRKTKSLQNGKPTAEMYGLTFMIPYNDPEPDLIPFQNTLALWTLNHRGNKKLLIELENHQVALVFDLRFSLNDQLDIAKCQLDSEGKQRRIKQIKGKRIHPGQFIRYLRLIDAKQKGISNRMIAEQFIKEGVYQSKERSSDLYFAAQSMIERDWRIAMKILAEEYRYIAYA
jgi:hypothetical protein